jgi:hypothetical protein
VVCEFLHGVIIVNAKKLRDYRRSSKYNFLSLWLDPTFPNPRSTALDVSTLLFNITPPTPTQLFQRQGHLVTVKETTAHQKREEKRFGEYVCVRTRQSGDGTS